MLRVAKRILCAVVGWLLVSVVVAWCTRVSLAYWQGSDAVVPDAGQARARHLIVGESELPLPAVLSSFGMTASGYWACWAQPYAGARPTAGVSVNLSAGFCDSVEQALEGARMKLDTAVTIPEVTGQATEYGNLGDRVWHSGARIVFVKGTVLVDVYASVSGDTDQEVVIALHVAKVLSRKIDAVLAGKPEPVPVIPFLSSRGTRDGVTTEEQGVEWAWAVKRLQESWGEQGTTLVFIDSNGLPRGIPAKKVGENDYLVLLTDLAAVVDTAWRERPSRAEATLTEVTILGKSVRVELGRSEVTVDGQPVQLGARVEWAGPVKSVREERSWPIPLVPLSLAEKALGVKVEFSKHGDLPITPPHWTPTITEPFAYTISEPMTCSVRVISPDQSVTGSVHVRYVVVNTWSDDHVEGPAIWDGSGSVPLAVPHVITARPKVRRGYTITQEYRFYVRRSEDSDWACAGTREVFHPWAFLTFEAPVGPWGTSQASGNRDCWYEVLLDACMWMPLGGYDSTQERDAMKRLAERAYWDGGKNYDGSRSHHRRVPSNPPYTSVRFQLWDLMADNWADCKDMALWWQKLGHSLGMAVRSRYASALWGTFETEEIDPVGSTFGWGMFEWTHHTFGWDAAVFDPCVQLTRLSPRVPVDEDLVSVYWPDLHSSGPYEFTLSFQLGDDDPYFGLPSEVD